MVNSVAYPFSIARVPGVISKYPLSDTVICKSLEKLPPFVTFTSSSCEQEEKLAIAAIKSADI